MLKTEAVPQGFSEIRVKPCAEQSSASCRNTRNKKTLVVDALFLGEIGWGSKQPAVAEDVPCTLQGGWTR